MRAHLPNIFTIGRIVLIPPFALLFFLGDPVSRWVAFGLFAAAAITDWFDGWLARRLNAGSALGRMMDPIADKLLVTTAILIAVATGLVSGWTVAAALAILLREIAVSGFREHLGPIGVVVHVTRLAKWKTATQFTALAMLVVPLGPQVALLGTVLLWVAAVLTVVTGYGYMVATVTALTNSDKRKP